MQRSGTIGFVGDTVATTPYAVGMSLVALEAARAADRVVLLMNSGGHRDLEARELATLRQYQIDGVLYATMYHPHGLLGRPRRGRGGDGRRRRAARAGPPPDRLHQQRRAHPGRHRAALEAGLDIPRDLSVVGFDDMEMVASGLYPGLTAMALPHYEMGAWGIQQLLALIDMPSRKAEQAKLSGQLIRRRSVAPPPV